MQTDPQASNEQEMVWVRECLGGNTNAFQFLVERSERMVRGMVRNMVRDTTQTEDLAQQSFVTAFEHLHQFNGQAKFSTWVCRIALNKCRDYLRERKSLEPLDAARHIAVTHDDPPTLLVEQESARQLKDAMGKLKPAERELITFKYLCGYSYELIAQILGCTPQTAKVRSFRAKDALKTILIDMGVRYG